MSKKLLLADDSITIQKVIQITFAHEDYELTITDNGDAAFAKAQEIKPDLVMADVYMPGKNGYELATAIKHDPALQSVPVLLLAGSFEPFDEDKARSCQADAWIEKPFESQNLIDKVAELLSAAPAAAAPAPAVEPEPVVEAAPEMIAETPLEEAPGEQAEVAMAPDDPFGDISFEEETPDVAPEPEPFAAADDWSDVAAEPAAVAPAFVDEPEAEVADDFSFAEESSDSDAFAPMEEAPVAEVTSDVFGAEEDDIMPLGEDDILGAEDLEPVPPEQTLASWSRDEAAVEDVFAEPMAEVPAIEEDVFAAPEEPVFVEEPEVAAAEEFAGFDEPAEIHETFDEPLGEPPSVFEEPAAETSLSEEEAAAEEPEPAAVAAAMAQVEERAEALNEDEIEQIIEKVVTKVVEKLAGSILERVAWEVVPDLAENMIREEIRKIKDAAA